jgi:hypothetical protein
MMHASFAALPQVVALVASLALPLLAPQALGALPTTDARVIADSEEPFARRIYSYDMDVDSNGDVHVIYSRPTVAGTDQVVYQRRVRGAWQPEKVLSGDGLRSSISTHLLVNGQGIVHVCYLRASTEHLYYRRIVNGTPGPEVMVDEGAWHTRMQIDDVGRPIFLREDETWPAKVSKLKLLRPTGAATWNEQYLGIPDVADRFRIADFVYQDGVFHVTYGDSSIRRDVLAGKGSTTKVPGTFHRLFYASSADGMTWINTLVDGSGNLYEDEFWTSLAVDGDTPLVGAYQYAEHGGVYNTGTWALLARRDAGAWRKRNITPADYAETRAGASIAVLVIAPGEYLGFWDFSPDNTYDGNFRGARGNMAIARNGVDNSWDHKVQLDPFSAEGRFVVRRSGERIHLLVLGDFVDSKLYYRELDLGVVQSRLDAASSGFPWNSFLPAILGAPRPR